MGPKKELAINFIENTQVKAVKRIYRSQHIVLRFLWFAALAVGLVCAVAQLWELLRDFLDSPLTSSSKRVADPTLENFPDVTVCNMNPLMSDNGSSPDLPTLGMITTSFFCILHLVFQPHMMKMFTCKNSITA